MSATTQEPATEKPRVVRLQFNRFVTFIKPWINLGAGAIAAWLVAKANVLGIPGLDQENTATWVAGALVWGLTTGVTQLGDLKWIKGHHISIEADATVTAAALHPVPPDEALEDLAGVHDPEVESASADVSDEDELAAPPPPDESNTPVQPSQVGPTPGEPFA